MASKVLAVFVVFLFSIAVVGAIPRYELRSENQDDVNCTDVNNQINSGNVCTLYQDIVNRIYLIKRYPNATEDFYRNVSQQLTDFCASQCKRLLIAFYNCQKIIMGLLFLIMVYVERLIKNFAWFIIYVELLRVLLN